MTEALLILYDPEAGVRQQYRQRLTSKFPTVKLNIVEHRSEVGPYIESAEIILSYGSFVIADDTLKRANRLKWFQALGTGVDGIVERLADRKHVLVTSTRGIHGEPMSESIIASMFALSRDIPRLVRNQDRRVRERWSPPLLGGKTVGVLGVGLISEALAPRCKALGMNVVGFSRTIRHVPGYDRMYKPDALADVAGELDYLVLLAPHTPENFGIVSARVLAAMKPTSYLINAARGTVVDEDALMSALRHRRIAGAALDVFITEPVPFDHPVWALENVIITHHVAAMHEGTHDFTLRVIEQNMAAYLAGNKQGMINLVER
jgi:D-2-hydroxyacid dehydrogenase (NADP+)